MEREKNPIAHITKWYDRSIDGAPSLTHFHLHIILIIVADRFGLTAKKFLASHNQAHLDAFFWVASLVFNYSDSQIVDFLGGEHPHVMGRAYDCACRMEKRPRYRAKIISASELLRAITF
jgi:hypothetical protein